MEGREVKVVQRMSSMDLTLCALFLALTAIGAFIKIPIPVVPFTLQFFFTMMAGLLLGGRLGAISVFGYLMLGLIGLPIFAEGGGLGYLLKPTFGYLIGFCAAAYVTGLYANKVRYPSVKRILVANFIGLFIVYGVGMMYYFVISNFVIQTPIGLWPLFYYCFVLAVPGDIALCILSAYVAKKLIPILRQIRERG